MAEHSTEPAELGAPMDYSEHEKTYNMFVAGTKYVIIFHVALLIAMALYFFSGAGFFSSLIVLVALCAIGGYLLR